MNNKNKTDTKKRKFSLFVIFSAVKNFLLSTQSVIGLDVGARYIKIVQLQKSRNNYTIVDYRVRALPSKVINNPQEKRGIISGFVNTFISESRIKTRIGRLAVWGAGSYIFSLTIPAASEKELKELVNIELKKKLPFQIDLASIFSNYFITNKIQGDKTNTYQLTCLAADRRMLDDNIKILKDIDVRPVVVNLTPDALGNLVGIAAKDAVYVSVLDMGAKESVLSFYKKGMLQFSRQIPIGGEQLSQAVMKAMVTLGMKNITEDDAEKVKRQCGIPLEEEAFTEYFTDFGVIKGNQIAVALRPILERFNAELARTINYYYRTFKVDKIEYFYLTGGSSRLKNIDKFLTFNLQNVNIGAIEKLNSLDAVGGWMDSSVLRREMVMEEASPHLSAAFGLSVGKGGKVNLLPPREILEQKINFIAILMRISFIVILTSLLGIYAFSYGKCLLYEKLISKVQTDIEKTVPRVKRVKDYMAMKGILTERKSLLESAIGKQPLWWGILKELSNVTPSGTVLKRLRVERKKGVIELHLIGDVFAEYTTIDLAISQYLVALDGSPFFANVRPASTERDVYSSVPKATFEIVCDLVY